MSSAIRMRERLSAVVDHLAALVADVPVKHHARNEDSFIVFVAPDYYWESPTSEQRARQLGLKRDYEPLFELVRIMLRQAPDDLISQFEDADSGLRKWLDLEGSNWSLSPSPDKNAQSVREAGSELDKILEVLEHTGDNRVHVVPDTNSLLATADPADYRAIAGNGFMFVLLPTVLGELDSLKVEHRNESVRDKAKAVIRRVRGWRDQGSLNGGVTVDKTITVQALHMEPDMTSTLSWLDPSIKDDRILASVLELQAINPAARVVLVTDDINLQNKADAALVESKVSP